MPAIDFSRFFTDKIWDLITTEIDSASLRVWHDVSVVAFVGIFIFMEICKLPCLRLYWTSYNICPGFCEIMLLTRLEHSSSL